MSEKEKLGKLEELLELDEGSLSVEMELTDIDEYDSVGQLSLIVLMEDDFGIKLDSEQIKGFKTVGDIVSLMN